MVKAWLNSLDELKYTFLHSRKRHHNVVLPGQFNPDLPVGNVVFWAQQWRRHFTHVHVRGPFSNGPTKELEEALGIPALVAPADIGCGYASEHDGSKSDSRCVALYQSLGKEKG
jgi:hypothetical protein